jgi:hypothetical protein
MRLPAEAEQITERGALALEIDFNRDAGNEHLFAQRCHRASHAAERCNEQPRAETTSSDMMGSPLGAPERMLL